MDPFGLIVFGGLAAFGLVLFLIGKYYPGTGADVLDWKPTRSYEQQVELEIEDLDQMLEAQNQRRRARGEAELTEGQMHRRVAEDLRNANARREDYLADEELAQLMEATNARRRRRGAPERTVDEVRAAVDGAPRPAGLDAI